MLKHQKLTPKLQTQSELKYLQTLRTDYIGNSPIKYFYEIKHFQLSANQFVQHFDKVPAPLNCFILGHSVLKVESLLFFTWFFDVLCGNYYLFWKTFFPIEGKQEVNNCFKPLISFDFTTVASRLKSEQKESEK